MLRPLLSVSVTNMCRLGAAALLTACSGSGTAPDPVENPGMEGRVAEKDTWTTLIEGQWSLDAGNEDYYCVRQTVTEDLYISAFRAPEIAGTHHAVLTLVAPTQMATVEPDGTTKCDGFTLGSVMVFGAGIGTGPMEFPSGVAAKIPAGTQMLMNLHVFNATDGALSGTTAIDIIEAGPNEVEHEAEIVLAGKVSSLAVPPGESTQTGTCTLAGDVTIFAALPHMHQLGTHMMTRALPAEAEPVPILDQDFAFDGQTVNMLATSLQLRKGDTIEVNCTYDNPSDTTVVFGQSSNAEMCYTGFYWYPPLEAGAFCYND